MKNTNFVHTYHPENDFELDEIINVECISQIKWTSDVHGLVEVIVDGLQHFVKKSTIEKLINID